MRQRYRDVSATLTRNRMDLIRGSLAILRGVFGRMTISHQALDLSFPTAYSRFLVKELRLADGDFAQLLVGTNLTRQALFALDGQISPGNQYRLIRNALSLSGNPELGLQIGAHMPLSAHGAIGVAVSAAPTPMEAFRVVSRYGLVRLPVIAIRIDEQCDRVVLRLDSRIPMDEVGRFLIEALITSILVLMEVSHTPLTKPPLVHFAYPRPPKVVRYGDYFNAELHFDQADTRITFARRDLEIANIFADNQVYRQALEMCERLQALCHDRTAWRSKVISLLQQHPGYLWRVEDIAAALHLSSRSLTRHLRAEGCTYQQLLDEELCRQAQMHLRMPGRSVAAIANILGYQDVSAFRRAFKRWKGISPADWRHQT